MDEATLQEKLRKIEALHAGATSEGEREATRLAAERIRARLAEVRAREPDVELAYSLPDVWSRKLFLALCRRYGLRPYRKYRQRHSTVQVSAPGTFQRTNLLGQIVKDTCVGLLGALEQRRVFFGRRRVGKTNEPTVPLYLNRPERDAFIWLPLNPLSLALLSSTRLRHAASKPLATFADKVAALVPYASSTPYSHWTCVASAAPRSKT
jgi:hypothetical protein